MPKRKVFKKKKTAKNHCNKGDSVYKVKGGWSISRKKRRK